jgi:hypothetical protein
MIKEKKVLVLFEDGIVREESILYAFELAKRLDLPVAFLMLVSDESGIPGMKEALAKKLIRTMDRTQMEASCDIDHGDKATQLLKYLAGHSTPAAIIWGSDERRIARSGPGRQHHWLNRLSAVLPCSIVSPTPKEKDKNRNRLEG